MKGILRAISIQTYGLYDKGKWLITFTVTNVKLRASKLDPLQGRTVDYDRQIKPLLK